VEDLAGLSRPMGRYGKSTRPMRSTGSSIFWWLKRS
jgi:hypothetical protein